MKLVKVKRKISEECLICLEDCLNGYKFSDCTCEQVYHKKCIERWLEVDMICPYCLYEFEELEHSYCCGFISKIIKTR